MTRTDTDLITLARSTADEARSYLNTGTEVAAGAAPEATLPLLLLAGSDVIAAGARLGRMHGYPAAVEDVRPPQVPQRNAPGVHQPRVLGEPTAEPQGHALPLGVATSRPPRFRADRSTSACR